MSEQICLSELRALPIQGLIKLAEQAGLEQTNNRAYKKHDLIMLLLKHALKGGKVVTGGGVLEVRQDGSAFARFHAGHGPGAPRGAAPRAPPQRRPARSLAAWPSVCGVGLCVVKSESD